MTDHPDVQQLRRQRERLAVDARRAIQNARFWLDYEPEDAGKARIWAEEAERLGRAFRETIDAEVETNGRDDKRSVLAD